MFKIVCLAAALASPLAAEPTSEIPRRREFPVSAEHKPCDDFYKYACTEVIKGYKLRDDRSRHVFSFNDSSERLLEQKKEYLRTLGEKKKKSKRARELSDFYSSCMNAEGRAEEERELVKKTVREVSNIRTREDFLEMLGAQVGETPFGFLNFGVTENFDKPDWHDVFLIAGTKSLPDRSYYAKPDVMADFKENAELFYRTIGLAEAPQRAAWLTEYETEFAQSYPLPPEFRQLFSERSEISREDLVKKYPAFEIGKFLKKIPQNTLIRDITPANFEFLQKALNESPLEELKSLFLYYKLDRYLDEGYPDYYARKFDFSHKHLGGPKTRPDRQERCTKQTMGWFGKEIDAELIPVLFPDFPQEEVQKLAVSIRDTMSDRLKKNAWLSEKGRAGALEKLKNVRWQLVKPAKEEDWGFNLPGNYSPKKYIANTLLYRRLGDKKDFQDMRKARNRDEWAHPPLRVNAYYSPSDNQFVLLQGILQYPFFDAKMSREANLGAMGTVVGHEIGHGFDDVGSKFDAQGRLNPWMPEEDLAQFKARTKILIEQYDAAGHNGEFTQGENIGDISGMSFAYDTAFANNAGTPEQKRAFFLQYARAWCQVMRPKELERRLKTDPHSQADVRVNEPLKHMAGFYEAYQCRENDKMYLPPEGRVSLW